MFLSSASPAGRPGSPETVSDYHSPCSEAITGLPRSVVLLMPGVARHCCFLAQPALKTMKVTSWS
jgi:hypothetical protein